LSDVGNNFIFNDNGDQIDIKTYLSNFIYASGVQSFTVPANIVNPAVYSITIEATIQS